MAKNILFGGVAGIENATILARLTRSWIECTVGGALVAVRTRHTRSLSSHILERPWFASARCVRSGGVDIVTLRSLHWENGGSDAVETNRALSAASVRGLVLSAKVAFNAFARSVWIVIINL